MNSSTMPTTEIAIVHQAIGVPSSEIPLVVLRLNSDAM